MQTACGWSGSTPSAPHSHGPGGAPAWDLCESSSTGARSCLRTHTWSACACGWSAERGFRAPETQVWLNGFRVDFHWPDLGLVVETDGLTYHRTPAQQNVDRRRDQAHTAAGLNVLRFTHAQVRFEPQHVIATLRAVAERIRG